MKEKIKKIGKFVKRHCFRLTMLQPKGNNQEKIRGIVFSYRDFLIKRGALRRKAKRAARRKRKRESQGKKRTRFGFIRTMFCNGLRLKAC